MTLNIQITTGSNTPIYQQIADQVRLAIAQQLISNGDQIPSVRQLAEQLLINPNTVAKAYAELQRDGILESRAGRGLFVAKKRQIYTKAERNRRLDIAIDNLISQTLALDFPAEEIVDALTKKLSQFNV